MAAIGRHGRRYSGSPPANKTAQPASTSSAARSASVRVGACVLQQGTSGITEASTTRSPATPRTPQHLIDRRVAIRAHRAGPDVVIVGRRIGADVLDDLRAAASRNAELRLAHLIEAPSVADGDAKLHARRRRHRHRPDRKSSSDRRPGAADGIGRGEPHCAPALRLHQPDHDGVALIGLWPGHVLRMHPAEDLDVGAGQRGVALVPGNAGVAGVGLRRRSARCAENTIRTSKMIVQVFADARHVGIATGNAEDRADDPPVRPPTASEASATSSRPRSGSPPSPQRCAASRHSTWTNTPRHSPRSISSLR